MLFNLLQPLAQLQESQLLWNQSNPASCLPRARSAKGCKKTPRAGVPLRKLVRCTEAQKCLSVTPLLATLTHSVSRKSFPCHSYANTWDGGGFRLPSNLEHPTSNLCICPSYAPRGASIPCAVTRLRILPVATGVYPFALPIPLRLWQSQLTRPLFSYSYELLFPQPLLFHIHTNPPGVWGDRSSRFNASLLGSYSAGVFLRN